MNEKAITVYIYDLDISEKSKLVFSRAGLVTLNDLLKCNESELAVKHGISEDVLCEVVFVKAHAAEIIRFFEERAERIKELFPETQDQPIESIGLSTRSFNALKRAGIHTIGALIRMSQRDIISLRNVGPMSREEITNAIESVVQSGKIAYAEQEELKIPCPAPDDTRIAEILPAVETINLSIIPFSNRARNALGKANITTVGTLIRMTEEEVKNLSGVGRQTGEEIVAIINAILEEGKSYFDHLESLISADEPEGAGGEVSIGKGFDFPIIDALSEHFGFKPVKLSDWLGLSRQSVYNILEIRSPRRRAVWTGKELSDSERAILTRLLEEKKFNYKDDKIICCCMNNMRDDFVALFIYENEIKCFFLKDLHDDLRERIISSNMHRYTEQELAGESDGSIVNVLTKPYYRPDNPERFRANAQLRGMTTDEYARFISGYPCLDQRNTTDEQIIAFLKENMVEGKVYISSDPKNQWIRSIASRNGYSMKDFIELYGFEPQTDNSVLIRDSTKERHIEELRKYIVHDNIVYMPADTQTYRNLHTYASGRGLDVNRYIRFLGFERTLERPDASVDDFEKDMEVRQCDGPFEEKVFAEYPLIGSRILKQTTVDTLNENSRKIINRVLKEPSVKLLSRAEMQITLALINYAKEWRNEENGNFWNYIALCFGYRDTGNGAVVKLLQSSLENAMKRNHRLFLEDANGRAFKSTAVIHALSPRKSWMALFDFLFDFYKSNLNWRVIPDDPLIPIMIRAIRQKLSGGKSEELDLTISSKIYSFQEGIWKLILYRPVYTRSLFERLIGKIDSLVNSDIKTAETYEEQLCEEWFKEKITAIANTKKTERQAQNTQREIAIDYSRIRPKYILKNETDVQIVLPDIRLKNENVKKAELLVSLGGRIMIRQSLSWYGNELGKTLNGVSVSLSADSQTSDTLDIRLEIQCDDEVIYDSEESLRRNVLLFFGGTEVSAGQVKRDRYTLVVPSSADVRIENAESEEIDPMNNPGLKAFFAELKDGYVMTVNGQLIAFDSENGTEVRVIVPRESSFLPRVTLPNREACLAYRKNGCDIILGNKDYARQYVILKNNEKIEFDALRQSDNGLAFHLPLEDEKDATHLQIINLLNERLVFDRVFLLIDTADCRFNCEFYYGPNDYVGARFCADIDDYHETVPFSEDEDEIRIPFRDGELHAEIPKITVRETSGAWLGETRPTWYIGSIPQNSLLTVTTPPTVNVRFRIGGEDIQYDGQGIVTIGNVLHSNGGTLDAADIVMDVEGRLQNASYTLARVFFKERFLKRPAFWTEEQNLFWDQGGAFVGNPGHDFTLLLSGDDECSYEFNLREDTESILLPADMPLGNYRYEISILTGGLFKKTKEVMETGDCVIGDQNHLRFLNRRIVLDSVTDAFQEETGHIPIRTSKIEQIRFCGMEETSEGRCPVYSGILYTTGYHGERYEFSFDVHTNKKGVTKMMVNPVRIVYISETALCITDPDGDGLYYYSYRDRELGFKLYALTDHEYTTENKHRYSNADLYIYHTERT